jgi:hypothetical protein
MYSHTPVDTAAGLSLTNHCYWDSQLYSPPPAQAVLVSWQEEKVVAEMPETTRAAEIMRAMISLRMCLSSLGGSRLCCRLCHVRGASPLELPLGLTTLLATPSPGSADKLAGREGRCRDAGDNQGGGNHEGNDQLTHVSFLPWGFEVMLSTLPCKRGIAPGIAVVKHCLSYNASAMPTCAWWRDGSCKRASVACLRPRHVCICRHGAKRVCPKI